MFASSPLQISSLFLLGILYLFFIDYEFGWEIIPATISDIGLSKSLIFLFSIFLTHLIRNFRLFFYLKQNSFVAKDKTPLVFFIECFSALQIYNLINLFFPFRSGELSFPIVLKKNLDVEIPETLGIWSWLRFLDLYFLVICLFFLVALQTNATLLVTFLLCLVACGLPLFLNNKSKIFSFFIGSFRNLPVFISKYISGMPQTLNAAGYSWSFTILNWTLKILILGFLISALSGLNLWVSTFGALGGELISISPIHAPGGVGSYALGVSAGISYGDYLNVEGPLRIGIVIHIFVVLGAFFSFFVSRCLLLMLNHK